MAKWASLQDRLGCSAAAAAAAATRFSPSRRWTAALSRRFVGRLECENKGRRARRWSRCWGYGTCRWAEGGEGKAQRSDPGVLTCGCCVALRCALSCPGAALRVHEDITTRSKIKALANWNVVPFRVRTLGQRNCFCTVRLGSAPIVGKHTPGRGGTYRSTQRLFEF